MNIRSALWRYFQEKLRTLLTTAVKAPLSYKGRGTMAQKYAVVSISLSGVATKIS